MRQGQKSEHPPINRKRREKRISVTAIRKIHRAKEGIKKEHHLPSFLVSPCFLSPVLCSHASFPFDPSLILRVQCSVAHHKVYQISWVVSGSNRSEYERWKSFLEVSLLQELQNLRFPPALPKISLLPTNIICQYLPYLDNDVSIKSIDRHIGASQINTQSVRQVIP